MRRRVMVIDGGDDESSVRGQRRDGALEQHKQQQKDMGCSGHLRCV